jgi:splicing factor U2AF subunit
MLKLTIPRPSADNPTPVGLGLIIIEYGDAGSALRAKTAMHGRKFGGHTVEGTFLNEADYAAGNYHNLGSL